VNYGELNQNLGAPKYMYGTLVLFAGSKGGLGQDMGNPAI